MSMKRILTVQDISCIGKCSGTVALPVLSSFGIETALLPTAVLSTHTGFSGFTFCDLTDELPAINAHWKRERFHFDACYSGYLGSTRQVQIIRDLFISAQQNGCDLLLVDPVMGDAGKMYAGFTPIFAEEMRSLCATASIILPNLTEAFLLLGQKYREDLSRQQIEDLLRRLSEIGAKKILLTGAELSPASIGALLYDAETDTFSHAETEKIPARFHGTGDLFASAVAGGMTIGKSAEEAMSLAVDLIAVCLRETLADPEHVWYGVEFEKALPWLFHRLYDPWEPISKKLP